MTNEREMLSGIVAVLEWWERGWKREGKRRKAIIEVGRGMERIEMGEIDRKPSRKEVKSPNWDLWEIIDGKRGEWVKIRETTKEGRGVERMAKEEWERKKERRKPFPHCEEARCYLRRNGERWENGKERLVEWEQEKALEEYSMNKFGWSEEVVGMIDWESTRWVCKRQSGKQAIQMSKLWFVWMRCGKQQMRIEGGEGE